MTIDNSLWFEPRPDHEIPGWIDRLWEEHRGSGGSLLSTEWLPPAGAMSLTRFSYRLLENLRFQTCEIYLAEPTPPDLLPSQPVLVGAAYRKSATTGRGKASTSQPTGVYKLTDPFVKGLRRLIEEGESADQVLQRLGRVSDPQTEQDRAIAEYVAYTGLATAIAFALRTIPAVEDRLRAESLWAFVKRLSANEGVPLPRLDERLVAAWRALATEHGELLLEGPPPERLVDQARERLELEDRSNKRITVASFETAITTWQTVSSLREPLLERIRAGDFPARAVPLLLKARLRSYPSWIHSATLTAWRREMPILIGDLRRVVRETHGRLIKAVNVPTLDGYEIAAGDLLLLGNDGDPQLRSMLLCPFDFIAVNSTDLRYRGFVRLMNRFDVIDGEPRLFTYPREQIDGGTEWPLMDDERRLASALADTLQRVLPHVCSVRLVSAAHATASSAQAADEARHVGADAESELGLVGEHESMTRIRATMRKVASADVSVLILGQSGTGKELVARGIHELSKRSDRPFEALDCGVLTGEALTIELFGAVEGAFDGLKNRVGIFERANGGTVFLDEIGNLDLRDQAKLARVLQQRVIQRVGDEGRTRPVDFRLIAATDAPLEDRVESREFLLPIYQRLRTVKIALPPLRSRGPGDKALLAQHFLRKHAPNLNPPVRYLSQNALQWIQSQEWPGNVRELEEAIKGGLVFAEDDVLAKEDIRIAVEGG